MDKGRHPHVVRTWTVERTKVPFRPPQSAKTRPDHFPPKKRSDHPVPTREREQ